MIKISSPSLHPATNDDVFKLPMHQFIGIESVDKDIYISQAEHKSINELNLLK